MVARSVRSQAAVELDAVDRAIFQRPEQQPER